MKHIFHRIRPSQFFPLFVFTLVCLFASHHAQAFIDATLQMQLGNPSGATTNTANGTNFLILRTVEALSYNTNRGKDYLIDQFRSERTGFFEKLMSVNRTVGQLETKLHQLEDSKL